MLIRRIARPMLSATFIARGVETLRDPTSATETAQSTLGALSTLPGSVGAAVPTDARSVAKVNAAVQVAGGLLLALGRAPRLTAAALAVTMIPGSLGSQSFLKETDPKRAADRRREFLTDVSLLGGLIIAAADTAGKPSLAWRGRRAAQQVSASVAAAVPGMTAGRDLADSALVEKIGHGLAVGTDRSREFADAAVERATELAAEFGEAAREHGPEVAEAARERATEIAHIARERAPELAAAARERSAALADIARTQLDQRINR